MEQVRLQKVMAEAGIAARRKCEELIEAGRVRVNSKVESKLPIFVDPHVDVIEVDGEPLPRPRKARATHAANHHYVLLHKPKRVISTAEDPDGRTTVLDLVDDANRMRLFPVGRLDADSTGLILLTNDGELTHRLTHPSFGVTKRYLVSVRGILSEEDIERLKKGLILANRSSQAKAGPSGSTGKKASMHKLRRVSHEADRTRGDRTTLDITLIEGQNREIRRLLARLGFKVRKLHRIAIGPITIKGLGQGQWRELTGREANRLRTMVGLDK